jgi:ferredoxin
MKRSSASKHGSVSYAQGDFMPAGQSFEVTAGTTILVSAIQMVCRLRHDCTEAICGTDRVKVLSAKNTSAKNRERE